MKPTIYEPSYRDRPPSHLYLPSTGTDPGGRGIGPVFVTSGGVVVSHPTPSNSYPNHFRRTRFVSPAAANAHLGIYNANADAVSAYRGDVASRGGFYFMCRFALQSAPNTNIRLFVGLSAQTGTGVCTTATAPANSVGLYFETGDALDMTIVTTDGVGGLTKTALRNSSGTLTPLAISPGTLYEFVMIANPNQGVIVTNVNAPEAGTLLRSQNVSATMPGTAIFMAPQAGMGNAANAAGGDCVFDIVSLYLRPNTRPTPIGVP